VPAGRIIAIRCLDFRKLGFRIDAPSQLVVRSCQAAMVFDFIQPSQ
jgi:hypothetical protein